VNACDVLTVNINREVANSRTNTDDRIIKANNTFFMVGYIGRIT
jgi:hypothetical protein